MYVLLFTQTELRVPQAMYSMKSLLMEWEKIKINYNLKVTGINRWW
jgi:hypothetical protein